ncbi:MAG: hypothetical protein HGA76_00650 [Candidatus Firestonebacteria bacterium]|nr:hypothetical protein [Candidatus Firestonebacteria bacterium]
MFTLTATMTPTSTPTATVMLSREIQIFPNPFRPAQAIGGTLKFIGLENSDKIKLFTVSGEKVMEKNDTQGRWEWDGKNSSGENVVTGVYVWVVHRAGGEKAMGKIFLVR